MTYEPPIHRSKDILESDYSDNLEFQIWLLENHADSLLSTYSATARWIGIILPQVEQLQAKWILQVLFLLYVEQNLLCFDF